MTRALAMHRAEARGHAERWLEADRARGATSDDFDSFYYEAPIGYMRLDRSGTILQVNTVARLLLGGDSQEKVLGKPLLVFVDRADTPILLKHLMRCRAGAPLVTSAVHLKYHRPVVIQLVSTRVVQRKPVGVKGAAGAEFDTIVTDISEQSSALDALRNSERRYRTIVETANEGICIADAENRITFVNQRLAGMLGASVDEVVGKRLGDYLPANASEREREQLAAADRGRTGIFELRLARADGSELWTSVSPSVIAGRAGEFVGLLRMFTDITDRKALEESRQQMVRHLVAAQEAERRRIARELHDQTGQHLVGLTLLLNHLSQLDGITPDVQGIIGRLKDITAGLSRDVHRLAVELRPTALDDLGLAVAVSNFADAISQQFGLHVDVHCALAHRLDPAVETTVYRVVQEALTNVVRHAHARQVSVIIENLPTTLRAVIEDDGVGFDQRGKNVDGRLGIAGMKERAALVGGELTIESSGGHGTTVFLRVPLDNQGTNDHEKTAPAVGG